ncbi:transcriptional regulator FeaR [Paraburkholderia silvatlantica]|uniref:transcriptional regulator FeaR n=1 Tax=Paraburkholderia silvatlantica TaxID=321895 RepID=UPI001061BB67|nr:transcriptional regulator FeaR [Paraburkholderia silvatlantica]TDQ98533.1 AraC family transcriptional regulator [Paraburkholderia silvatlantica]
MNTQSATTFERWNDEVVAICGQFRTRPSEHVGLFVGEIRRRDLGGLGVADIQTNACSITRVRGAGTASDDRYCFLVLQRAGTVHVRGDADDFVLVPGEMALLDSARSFEMRPQGLLHQMSIHLPRDVFERPHRESSRRFGKLSRHSLNGQLLRDMLLRIAGMDGGEAAVSDGETLQEALGALSRAALEGDERTVDQSLRARAERLIAQTLQDEEQSPAHLAARLGISVRRLYRLFESDGESVGRYVRRMRLQASSADLVRAELNDWTITSIAQKWGFADEAHFSRLFKRHFGVPPREYRRRHGG